MRTLTSLFLAALALAADLLACYVLVGLLGLAGYAVLGVTFAPAVYPLAALILFATTKIPN